MTMFTLNYYAVAANKPRHNFLWMTHLWLKRPMPTFKHTAHLHQTAKLVSGKNDSVVNLMCI